MNDKSTASPTGMKGKTGPRKHGPTPLQVKTILASLKAGTSQSTAHANAGVARSSFYDWLARGRKLMEAKEAGKRCSADDRHYLEFFEELERADAVCEDRLVRIVSEDAAKNAESAKWLLTRLNGRRWGDRVNVVIEEELKNVMGALKKGLRHDEYLRALEAISGVSGSGMFGPGAGEPHSGAAPSAVAGPDVVDPAVQPEVPKADAPPATR